MDRSRGSLPGSTRARLKTWPEIARFRSGFRPCLYAVVVALAALGRLPGSDGMGRGCRQLQSFNPLATTFR